MIDDNLAALGAKSIIKPDDVALFTGDNISLMGTRAELRWTQASTRCRTFRLLAFAARAHIWMRPSKLNATMFKLVVGDQAYWLLDIFIRKLREAQLEAIGLIDLSLFRLAVTATLSTQSVP